MLTVEGLRSYQNKTVIDFSDLSLFAIVGDTGAGKSSIIEALCYALYGSGTGGGVTDLRSDGLKRMSVELLFSIGDTMWAVTRGISPGASIHKLVSDKGVKVDGASLVNAKVEALLGLNKEQFLKAVVMPQGRFEELLRATAAERTAILKGIFRLQHLDQVRVLADGCVGRLEGPLNMLVGERRTLPTDPADHLYRAKQGEADAVRHHRHLDDSLTKVRGHLQIATDANSRAGLIDQAVGRVRVELGDLDPGLLTAALDAADQIAADRASRLNARAGAESRLEEADLAAADALDGFAGRDDAVTARTLLTGAATTLATLKARADEAVGQQAELAEAEPSTEVDPAFVAAAQAAADTCDEAEAHREELAGRLEATAAAIAGWARSAVAVAVATAAFDDADVLHAGKLAAVKAADAAVEDAADDLRLAEEALASARRADAAATASASCRPGEDCPICARTLPPGFVPPIAFELTAAAGARDGAAARQTRAVEQATSCATTAAKLKGSLDAAETVLVKARSELHASAATLGGNPDLTVGDKPLDAFLQHVLNVAVASSIRSPTSTDRVAARIEELLAGLRAGLIDRAAVAGKDALSRRDRQESTSRDLVLARASMASAHTAWEAALVAQVKLAKDAAREADATLEGLAGLPARWRPPAEADGPALDALADQVAAALDVHAGWVSRSAAASKDLTRAEEELRGLDTGEATRVHGPVTRATAAGARLNRAIAALAEACGTPEGRLVPAYPVDAVCAPSDALRFVTAVSDSATYVLDGADARLADLRATEKEATEAWAALLAAIPSADVDALIHAIGEASAKADAASIALADATAQAARAEALDVVLGLATPFIEDLQALRALLRPTGFVASLVATREAALLVAASTVLRELSGGRFGFADGFKVVDLRTGNGRGPGTLSGGERFQASLALALALVEIATRGGGQLEAVFVDEGFGSLDARSLDQALATLGGLAADGKLVALVSHLGQVAEAVDMVLLVERDPATGSSVRFVDAFETDQLGADDARGKLTS